MTAPLSHILLSLASFINRDLMRSTGAFMGIPSRVNRFWGRWNARSDSMRRACRPAAAVMMKLTMLLCACR